MTPDDYCAAEIGGPDSNLYYSLLFLPSATRRAASAVHAFAHEVNDVVDECEDPGVARTKLDWWREEILRTYAGAARHPITQALAPVIAAQKFKRELLLAIINAAEATLGHVRFETFDALRAHCHATGSIPAELAAMVLGFTDPATRRSAQTLGLALRLTEIVANIGHDVRRDRLYLPAEELRRFGATESDMLACRHTPALESLLAYAAERARRLLDDADAHLPDCDRANQLPGQIQAALARVHLDEINADGYRTIERRLALTPIRKLWIAWKTRARERRRARRHT
jgi:15-cis-phytoene synthase